MPTFTQCDISTNTLEKVDSFVRLTYGDKPQEELSPDEKIFLVCKVALYNYNRLQQYIQNYGSNPNKSSANTDQDDNTPETREADAMALAALTTKMTYYRQALQQILGDKFVDIELSDNQEEILDQVEDQIMELGWGALGEKVSNLLPNAGTLFCMMAYKFLIEQQSNTRAVQIATALRQQMYDNKI